MRLINSVFPSEVTRKHTISSLLGFKLTYLLQQLDLTKEDPNRSPRTAVPHSLLLLVALLIREDIIDLEDIWPYLKRQERKEGKFQDVADEVAIYH